MLRIRRTFVVEELGFRLDSHLGLAEDHRVIAIGLAASMLVDSRLLPREPSPERTYLYMVLDGTVELHASRTRLTAPACVVAESRAAFHDGERSRARGPLRALGFQLDGALLEHRGPPAFHALSPDVERAARAMHDALVHPVPWGELARAEAELFASLRCGPLPGLVTPVLAAPNGRHERFADALSRVLAQVGERPAQVDLVEDGDTSERTVRRLFSEIAERYGWVYDRWQTLRRQWSTTLACLLLVMPDAHPRDVAKRVGFASLTSLHHALERAGMPPPRELQSMAARLAEHDASCDLTPAIAKNGHPPSS